MSPEAHGSGKIAIALAIIAAISGWGTSLITNWKEIFGEEEIVKTPTPPIMPEAPCKNIEGQWQRSIDNLIIEYTQSGCVMAGRVLSDSGANSHQISAVMSGKYGAGYTRRSIGGCTTILSGEYQLLSGNQLKISAKGNGCDLDNYSEEFVYTKIR